MSIRLNLNQKMCVGRFELKAGKLVKDNWKTARRKLENV